MTEGREIAIDSRAAALVLLWLNHRAGFLIRPWLSPGEGLCGNRITRAGDLVGGEFTDGEAGKLLRPALKLSDAGQPLLLVKFGEYGGGVVLRERIEARALRGGVREVPPFTDCRLERCRPGLGFLPIRECRRLGRAALYSDLRTIGNNPS